jgi:hypothetical protein
LAVPATPSATELSNAPDLRLSGDMLRSLLLRESDLPSGYSANVPGAPMDAGNASVAGLGTGVQQCGGAQVASTGASGSPDGPAAQTFFTKGMTGPFIAEVIAAPGNAAARQLVDAVAKAPSACPNFSGKPEQLGSEVTVSLSQLTVPHLGDVSSGAQLVADMDGLPVSVRGKVYAIAYRGLAVTVVVMGLTEVDKVEAESIATAAARRVQSAG